MTAKEYLLQIKEQRNDILNQEEYIQRLRDSLGVAGIRYDKERVQSSPEPDKFAKIFGQPLKMRHRRIFFYSLVRLPPSS